MINVYPMKIITAFSVLMFVITTSSVFAETTPEHSRTTITRSHDTDRADRVRDDSNRDVSPEDTDNATVLDVQVTNTDGDVDVTVFSSTHNDNGNADISVVVNGSTITGNEDQSGNGNGDSGVDGQDGRDGTDTSEEDEDEDETETEPDTQGNRYDDRPERDTGDRDEGRRSR